MHISGCNYRNAKELYEFAEINIKDPAPSRYQSENVKVKRRIFLMIFRATVEVGILKKLKETDPFMRLCRQTAVAV